MKTPSLTALALLGAVAPASASTVIDLRSGGIGGAFDGQASGFVGATGIPGLLLTVTVSSDTGPDSIGVSTAGLGVNNGTIAAADSEALAFSFNLAVDISALDFAGLSAGETGTVSFSNGPLGSPFDLTDNSSADDLDFATPVRLPAGATVTIANTGSSGSFNFERIALAVVPEPASLALLGVGGLALAGRRRR